MRRLGTRWLATSLAAGLACATLLLAGCGTDDGDSCTPTAQLETAATCADGLDNDCDGFADGDDSDCAGVCTPTATSEADACDDGVDNDCDGAVDDADTDCGATCTPTTEACDNADNDCDGATDEDLTQDCVKDGQTGSQTCAAGAWGECQIAGPPPVEICNGEDDNANGQVDEGLQRVCNTACGDGVEQCIGGEWANCDAPQPETETCNERDDDCDGQVDEDLTRVCESDCGQGEETCSLGNWVGCDAPRPAAETCDNVDNDCDAMTDEDLSKACTTACGDGAQTCTAGQWSVCSAREPDDAETCGDGIDNDCNGVTDGTAEGCVQAGCDPGTQANCRGVDAQLLCQDGIKVCGADREFGPCQLGAQTLSNPTAESCNGRDDDCDGGTDESFPGMGDDCGAGPGDSTLDEGECQSGTWACVGGQIVCDGMIAPTDEICDDLDNDCDGGTDNDMDADEWEANETCPTARPWAVGEDQGPVVVTGTLYPQGDVDFHIVTAQEGSTPQCLIGDPDNPYEVVFELSNVPEGVEYDICVTVDWAKDLLQSPIPVSEFCAEDEPIIDRWCITEAVDGVKGGIVEVSEATCFISDDVYILIEVIPRGEADFSCAPYTLAVQANGL